MITMRLLYAGLFFLLCGAAAADPAAAPSEPNVVEQARSIRQILRDEQIRTVTADANEVEEELPVLDALIEELESLESSIKVPTAPELAAKEQAAEPVMETPVEETPIKIIAEEAPAEIPAEPVSPVSDVSAVVEAEPNRVQPDPLAAKWDSVASVGNPLKVADTLYLSGRPQQAERFYRQVTDKENQPEDAVYQWALYQSGVCNISDDPAEARRILQKFVESCPNSPWTSAARARLTALALEATVSLSNLERINNDPNSL